MRETPKTVLGRVLAMPGRERGLLARTLLLVAGFRIALWIVPASQVRRLSARPAGQPPSLSAFSPEHLAWAVRAVARRVPGATCLTQALALHRLLALAGKDAEIRVGVAKGKQGSLESHAWVVCHDRVLAGEDRDLDRFAPILSMGMKQP